MSKRLYALFQHIQVVSPAAMSLYRPNSASTVVTNLACCEMKEYTLVKSEKK